MQRWKIILTVLCLATWFPATQHCKLENLSGFAFLQCETESPGGAECEGDGCQTVEGGAYKSPEEERIAPQASLVLVWTISQLQKSEGETNSLIPVPSSAPPDIPTGWQFMTRAASPPRAPSLVS